MAKNYKLVVKNDDEGMTLEVNGCVVAADLNSVDLVCAREGWRMSLAEFSEGLKKKADKAVQSHAPNGYVEMMQQVDGVGQYL